MQKQCRQFNQLRLLILSSLFHAQPLDKADHSIYTIDIVRKDNFLWEGEYGSRH